MYKTNYYYCTIKYQDKPDVFQIEWFQLTINFVNDNELYDLILKRIDQYVSSKPQIKNWELTILAKLN